MEHAIKEIHRLSRLFESNRSKPVAEDPSELAEQTSSLEKQVNCSN